MVPASITRRIRMKDMREKMKGRKFRIGCLPAIFVRVGLGNQGESTCESFRELTVDGAPLD